MFSNISLVKNKIIRGLEALYYQKKVEFLEKIILPLQKSTHSSTVAQIKKVSDENLNLSEEYLANMRNLIHLIKVKKSRIERNRSDNFSVRLSNKNLI